MLKPSTRRVVCRLVSGMYQIFGTTEGFPPETEWPTHLDAADLGDHTAPCTLIRVSDNMVLYGEDAVDAEVVESAPVPAQV